MRNFIGLARALFLQAFRNKFSFFFNILLPLIFFIMFGLVFSDLSGSNFSFAYFSDIDLNIEGVRYRDKELLLKEKNKFDAIAIVVADDEIIVYKNFDDYTVDSWIESLKIELERKLNNSKKILEVDEKPINIASISQLEYIFTGTLALSIMSIGMFSTINIFSTRGKSGLIKRFKVLPLSPTSFVFSFSFSQFLIGFVSIILIRITSIFLFSMEIKENLFYIVISIISSTLGMIGFGVILSVLFPRIASSIAQVLYTIFIFFSGIYFPTDFLPKFLKFISLFTPVKYMVNMFRYSYGIKEISQINFFIYSIFMSLLGIFLLSYGGKILFYKEE
ncbi:MAG: ABC transporter permease [Thermosipho sp. (in: Bacteria)]|nr:ABC transporter permease [Thermosipho sp. (in: thermotogales)]